MYSTLLPLCTGTLGRYKYSLLCMDYPFSTHYSQLPGDTVLLSFSKKDLTFHKGVRSCNTHLSVPGLSNIIIFSITLVTNYSIWLIFVAKYLWHISNPFTSWWILVLFCYFCFFLLSVQWSSVLVYSLYSQHGESREQGPQIGSHPTLYREILSQKTNSQTIKYPG